MSGAVGTQHALNLCKFLNSTILFYKTHSLLVQFDKTDGCIFMAYNLSQSDLKVNEVCEIRI